MPLYQAAPAANELTDITGGGAVRGTYLLTLCNRTSTEINVRVALTAGEEPTDKSWINYDYALEEFGVLSRHPIAMEQGWRIYVLASASGVSVTCNGEA